MQLNNLTMSILIKGRRIDEFQSPMNFQRYVEGRAGSEFEIEIRNDNPYKIEAIISVDGLSITDGEQAGDQSSGYLVEANSRVTIPGWKLDSEEVAKFVFTGKDGSYSAKAGKGVANVGVIGLRAFKPRYKCPNYNTTLRSKGISPSRGWDAMRAGIDTYNAVGMSSTTSMTSAVTQSFDDDMADALLSSNNLGTGFGEAEQFRTQEVQFERGELLSMMEIFYDDRQGLKTVGINVSDKQSRPASFPANEKGCQPPADWAR